MSCNLIVITFVDATFVCIYCFLCFFKKWLIWAKNDKSSYALFPPVGERQGGNGGSKIPSFLSLALPRRSSLKSSMPHPSSSLLRPKKKATLLRPRARSLWRKKESLIEALISYTRPARG